MTVIELTIPRDDEFRAQELRVRTILRRLKACHKITASPRSVNPAASLERSRYPVGAPNALNARQEWMVDVENALKRGAGTQGARVLIARATRQSESQANGFKTIAIEMNLAESDVVFIYRHALTSFLFWMGHFRVADDYRPEAELPVVSFRRNAA